MDTPTPPGTVNPPRTVSVNVKMTPQEYARIREIAAAHGTTMSHLLRAGALRLAKSGGL